MSDLAIFVFGSVAFGIVIAACALITWGMITERRDRFVTDAAAEAAGANVMNTATTSNGRTAATTPMKAPLS